MAETKKKYKGGQQEKLTSKIWLDKAKGLSVHILNMGILIPA